MRRILAIAMLLSLLEHETFAAPVTLTFNAQVQNVFQGSGFTLPFAVSPGDLLHGSFTFEPGPVAQAYSQNLGMSLSLPNATLNLPRYQVSVGIHQFPPIVFDADLQPVNSSPFDSITIGCLLFGSGNQCGVGTVTGVPEVQWQPFLSIGGDSPILAGYEVPGEVNIWNQFTRRSISLSFTPPTGVGLVRVDALLGAFSAVPEPTTADFNHDGHIDSADYVSGRKILGSAYYLEQYALWRANYGKLQGSGAGVGFSTSTIPEPATIALAIFGVMVSVSLRARQR